LCVVTALSGCAGAGTHAQQGLVSTAPNVRVVQGEAVEEAPLLPEPGDIWAHIVPGRAADGRASSQAETVAAAPPAPSAVKQAVVGDQPQNPLRDALPKQPAATAPGSQAPESRLSETIVSGVQVQLTAAATQQKALGAWQLLAKRQPDLLRGHPPKIVQLEAGEQTRWRLRAGGFMNTAAAQTFCNQVKAAGLDCWVVGPAM
jgi:hypothetical protein